MPFEEDVLDEHLGTVFTEEAQMQMETDSHPSSDPAMWTGPSTGCGETSSTPSRWPPSLMT